jgi:hypothetical protein
MSAAGFRERVAYRRWQDAVKARDAADVYDPSYSALADEARRLQRVWGHLWDANTREQNAR